MIIDLIKEVQPDIVVNTAAHSSVDLCETDHSIADKLHVDITQDITQVCKDIDSKLVYISTDAVFQGELHKKYTELDQPNPINYYGKTKLQAEQITLNASSKNVVLRTAVIYGWHKKSRFTNWIIQTLKENHIVDPFIDQYNTPTLVDDLAKSLLSIFEKNISGMFHATGKSCLNRYEFALVLASTFGLDKKLIKSVTSKEKKQDAPRPTSTCLDSRKLEKLIDFNFSDIQSGVSFIFNKSKLNSSS
jgi:dTDP-4-dehydrorhamnose reductase